MSNIFIFYYSDSITMQCTLPDIIKHLTIYYSIKYATVGYNYKLCYADVGEKTVTKYYIKPSNTNDFTIFLFSVLNGLTVLISFLFVKQ